MSDSPISLLGHSRTHHLRVYIVKRIRDNTKYKCMFFIYVYIYSFIDSFIYLFIH